MARPHEDALKKTLSILNHDGCNILIDQGSSTILFHVLLTNNGLFSNCIRELKENIGCNSFITTLRELVILILLSPITLIV